MNKLIKLNCLFVLTILSTYAQSESLYHCKQADGTIAFQDRPCQAETIKVENEKNSSAMSQEHMLKVLGRLTGKSEKELQDPKLRQAAEALVATDAGKAYAYTKVYGVASKHCGDKVSNQLSTYKEKAKEVISLGQYYYRTGMFFQIGSKKFSHTGQELTDALNQMLNQEESKYKYANRIKLNSLCKEANKALKSLIMVYGS